MLVLGVGEHERVGTDALSHVSQRESGDITLSGAEVDGIGDNAVPHHLIGEAELPVELQSPRMQAHRAGFPAGPFLTVDDPHRNATTSQAQSHHQAGGSRPDDQN